MPDPALSVMDKEERNLGLERNASTFCKGIGVYCLPQI